MFKKKNDIILAVSVVFFLLLWMMQPDRVMEGTTKGLILWYRKVLPAQFVFTFGVNLLMRLSVLDKLPAQLMIWLSGMMTGFPMGAMVAAKYYQRGIVTEKRITRLAAAANMAGPMFVIGTLGAGMLGSARWGYILLLIQWICAGIVGFFPVLREKRKPEDLPPSLLIGELLGMAMEETAELMLKICGFVVLFSVLSLWFSGAFGIMLELTNGLHMVAEMEWPLRKKLCVSSFLLNTSGLSVIFQSMAAAKEAPVSFGRFFCLKYLQGCLGGGIMWLFCQFLNL